MSLQAAIQLVQGAATAGSQKLRALQSALDGVRGRVDRARSSFASWLKTANQRPRDDKGRWLPDTSLFGRARAGLASVRQGLTSAAGAASTLKGLLAGALLAGAGALVGAGARYAADTLSFRENTLFAFKYITGSQQKAEEMMRTADELARSLGAKTTDVGESLRELMSGGFDADTSRAIVSAIADVRAMNPKANIEAISTQLAQMKGAGRVLAEDLKPLLNAGVNDDIFYQVLREMTGQKDQAALKKMLSSGKVSSDQGIAAILETIKRQGNSQALGEVAAAKAATTLGGAFENAKGQVERLFLAINTGPVGQKLIALTHRAANLFDPAQPGGKRLLAILDRVVVLGARVVESLSLEDLSDAFGLVSSAGERFMGIVEPLSQGFGAGFREASGAVRMIVNEFNLGKGSAGGMANALQLVGTALGWVAVGIGVTVGGLTWLVAKLTGVVGFVWGAGASVGVAIIEGITGGLESAKSNLVARLTALAELLPDSVRKLLKIQSPSRVFMQIGAHTTAGFVAGLEQGPQPHARMVELMRPPPPEPLPAPGLTVRALAPRSASPIGPVVLNLTVNVEGRDIREPEQLAERIGTEVRRAVTALFEELALEAGAT